MQPASELAAAPVEAAPAPGAKRPKLLTLMYSAASMCGLVSDLLLLKLLIGLGLSPAWARVVSLFFAMQVTFCINGFLVFRSIEFARIHRQWAAYMATNAFGNLCNYLVFTTLLSLHRAPFSNHTVAVLTGGFVAWAVNYTAARLVVFNPNSPAWLRRLTHAPPQVRRPG